MALMFLMVVLLLVWVVYIGLLLACGLTWSIMGVSVGVKDKLQDQSDTSPHLTVSVIIPMRNEAHNLPRLWNSLKAQDYPSDKVEFIAVDDNSQDQTPDLLQQYAQESQGQLKVISLKDPPAFKGSYKKRALSSGISKAQNNLIITTDADCVHSPSWLTVLTSIFHQQSAVLISGPVYLTEPWRGLTAFAALEQAALTGIGACFLKWGYPNMCNGANLAFTRVAFNEVGGYEGFEHVVSGDDEFLLYKMSRQYPGQVCFVKHPQAAVETRPPTSWKDFFHQRKRWSGKWKYHRSYATRGLALFIFLFHFTWLASWAVSFLGIFSWSQFAALMLTKALAEYILMFSVMRLAGKIPPLGWFLGGQFLYSFYALFMGIAANLGTYSWKNRDYS